MNSEVILQALLRLNLTAGAAILLTLALRPMLSRGLGARAAYRLWLLVPIVVLTTSLPPLQDTDPVSDGGIRHMGELLAQSATGTALKATAGAAHSALDSVNAWLTAAHATGASATTLATVLLAAWALTAVLLLAHSGLRSYRAVAGATLGPALIGVWRPKLILPPDFAQRFNAREQALVLAHESEHQAARHPLINAVMELMRCVNWVNPLVHLAVACIRADQEMACDAAVMERYPRERRAYAEALLKTQMAGVFGQEGCPWPGRSADALRRRIHILAQRPPGRSRTALGIVILAGVITGSSYVAWSAQSQIPQVRTLRVAAASSAPSLPPTGLLTPLEARVHQNFLKAARRGDINLVFIGDSVTDFWRYEWGGRKTWDRMYVPLKAVNFGVEGAHTRSVLWRLQNGELDGYQAKVIVVTALGVADYANHGIALPDILAGDAEIIATVRRLQPQARILLVAVRSDYPSVVQPFVQELDSKFLGLADNRSIFALDLRDRFAHPEGLYATGHGASLGPGGYALWAEGMNQKLTELMK